MIPRSLPPLPPQISYEAPDKGDSVHIDSPTAGPSVSHERPRPKRKNKSHSNSRKSHFRHGNIGEEKNSQEANDLEDLQPSDVVQNHDDGSLPSSDETSKTKSQKIVNLSILERLRLKRQNRRDADGTFEMRGEHAIESPFSENRQEKLPVTVPSCLNGNVASQPIAKMFLEEERGFRAISDFPGAVAQSQSALCDSQPAKGVQSAVELAVKTEKFFHTFSTFCHGLLAGMALWQCIIVYQLGPPHFETADFFSHYSCLSQPMQTLFYFFFVICIVSAFDRYDIGNPQCSDSKCAMVCRSGIIIVVIYPVSLFLSLGIANIDDKMSLHNYNASLWTSENALDMDHDLFYWKILNLGRCIGAVVGWIIVALQPNVNSFLHRLEYVSCTVK